MPRVFDFSRLSARIEIDQLLTSEAAPKFAQGKRVHALSICILYGSASLFSNYLQRHLREAYGYSNTIEMALVQVALLLVIFLLAKQMGRTEFEIIPRKNIRQIIPLVVFYVAKILLVHFAQPHLSVDSFAIFRRLTTLIVLWLEIIFLGSQPPTIMHYSIILLVSSAMVTDWAGLSWNYKGITLMIVGDFMTAGELVWAHKYLHIDETSKSSVLLWNCHVLSFPLLVIAWGFSTSPIVPLPEKMAIDAAENQGDSHFVGIMFACAVSMLIVRIASVWCIESTSSLTTSVVGNVKHLLSWIIRELLFPTFIFVDARIATAALVNLLAAIGYIYLAILEEPSESKLAWYT